MYIKKKNQSGFSLVELMVVVGIIGILAGLALPRFRVFQAKARQAEAKGVLGHLYVLQSVYFGENNNYSGLTQRGDGTCTTNRLGFSFDGCINSTYQYSAGDATAATQAATQTLATAVAGAADTADLTQYVGMASAPQDTVFPGCGGNTNEVQQLTDQWKSVEFRGAQAGGTNTNATIACQ